MFFLHQLTNLAFKVFLILASHISNDINPFIESGKHYFVKFRNVHTSFLILTSCYYLDFRVQTFCCWLFDGHQLGCYTILNIIRKLSYFCNPLPHFSLAAKYLIHHYFVYITVIHYLLFLEIFPMIIHTIFRFI